MPSAMLSRCGWPRRSASATACSAVRTLASGLIGVEQAVGQRDQYLHAQRTVGICLAQRALQQAARLEEAVAVEAHDGQPAQRLCSQVAGCQPLDGLLEHGARALLVACVEMVQGGTKPTLGGVTAEADRQVDQLGGRRGCPAHARRLRRRVERPQRDFVTAGRGQRQMPRPQFGLVDDVGEAAMHRSALARRGFGVHAPGQQGMREVDPVAVDRDDALAFRVLEQLDQPVVVADRRARHQLHRRRGHARRGEQRIVHVGIEAADPGPHNFGQRAWQRRLDAGRAFGDRPCQFDCVEGVSAGYLVDATHRRARERSPQPGRHRCVQIVNTQRMQSDSVHRVGPGHLQPARCLHRRRLRCGRCRECRPARRAASPRTPPRACSTGRAIAGHRSPPTAARRR